MKIQFMRSLINCARRRSSKTSVFFLTLTILILPHAIHAQAPPCPDPAAAISGSHTFHSQGEILTIPFSFSPCHTVAVNISWANGLNNGSNLKVTFFDASGQPIYSESTISAFLPGSRTFPFSSPYPYPWRGSRSALFNPTSVKIETIFPFGDPCDISYTLTFAKRENYNTGGDNFGNAPLVLSLPANYLGSMYDGRTPPPGGTSVDPGQYIKVRLKCNQAMYVHGSVTVSSTVSSNFVVDIYDANQQLVVPGWIFTGSMGTTSFASNPFVNPNSSDTDYYLRIWSFNWPIYDFNLTVDEYVQSNSSTNPRTAAPDATGGSTPNNEEFKLPAGIDSDVLTARATELWGKVYWPQNFSGGPYPLVAFLHGNHTTCGHGSDPRIDDNSNYTLFGTCNTAAGYSPVPSHLGYEYLATQLASQGYIVLSINANRGITGAPTPDSAYPDDPLHIFSRARLVLKHLETLKTWNSGPTRLITGQTLGTSRKNATGWFGMKITVGPQPIKVYSLGRMFLTGNNQTHALKIVRASDGLVLANPALAMSGGTNGSFKYVDLVTPVQLAANTSYYIVSEETRNKDAWYDSNTTVTATALAAVDGRVTSTDGISWSTAGAVPGNVYVPLDLKYQVLGVNLTGKIDFSNVGLMGHSRGGQGVLAAYNLYRNPAIDPRSTPADITWSTRIPGMSIKGIFEIAPSDFELPTNSNGTGSQFLNADGTAWNVLLPMCDGDLRLLPGVHVFDRMMFSTDSPATQKSTYTAWGSNHNFFNSQWQQSEVLASCVGSGNTPLFANPALDGNGSPNQRIIGSASLLAFFRANVGSSPTASFNQNFNPRYDHSAAITSITPPVRIDRGFTPSPSLTVTKVLFDFLTFVSWPAGTSVDTLNLLDAVFGNMVPNHDPSLSAGLVTWDGASCGTILQTNWKNPNTGDNISGYQTLDFRVSRANDPLNSSASTNFQIQLIAANGSPTGAGVSLNKYISLTGPVGTQDLAPGDGLHPILQTVRIPLTDFKDANLTQVRGVRFIFSDTGSGAIYLANLRLSNQP